MCDDEKRILKIISVNFVIGLLLIIFIDACELKIIGSKMDNLDSIYLAITIKTIIAIVIYIISIHGLTKLFNKKLNFEYMTGLYSRRKLFIDLNDLISNNSEFTLCYIDFNNLKVVNDNYGHTAGDMLINEFSRRICLLKSQKVVGYRIGGDEFIVIIKDKQEKESCLENIWKITEEDVKVTSNKALKISFTMGVVDNDFVSTVEELLIKADSIMYKNKRG